MLYQTLLQLGENKKLDEIIKELKPDLIVIDEMHHVKAYEEGKEQDDEENEWGKK